MTRRPSELVEGSVSVASLPAVYLRLNEIMQDSRSSVADLGNVVSEDTGLSARLLLLVNSAFYGFPSKIDTISQALAVVGTSQVHDLALATSVISMFKGIPDDLVDMDSFWRHSLACGVCARVLAAQRREANIERLFVAGMLHDIGRLLLFLKNTDQAREAVERCRESGELLYQVEHQVMGYDHAAVGRALMEAWKLPASLLEPVAYHHNPNRAKRYPTETAILHVADIMAHAMQLGHSGERLVPPLVPSAWKSLNLDPTIIHSMWNDIDRQYTDGVRVILGAEANEGLSAA